LGGEDFPRSPGDLKGGIHQIGNERKGTQLKRVDFGQKRLDLRNTSRTSGYNRPTKNTFNNGVNTKNRTQNIVGGGEKKEKLDGKGK